MILQKIKCFFGRHKYVGGRQIFLPCRVCKNCKHKQVLMPTIGSATPNTWVDSK